MMGLYLSYQPEASAEDRIMMGQNHVQLGRLPGGAVLGAWRDRAGGRRRRAESWLQLELAIHFELGDHRAALRVLRTLVARWPDRLRYWEMMAGAHQALGPGCRGAGGADGRLQRRPHQDRSRKLLNLVRMNLYVELPYQAGRILSRAMEDGRGRGEPGQPGAVAAGLDGRS
jgi:hypothetical protein